MIILSLDQKQAEDAVETLKALTDIKLTPVWGNIFVPAELKDLSRNEILDNVENRQKLIVERDNRLRIVQAVRRERKNYEGAVRELAAQSEELQNLLDLIGRRIKSQILLGDPDEGDGLNFLDFRGRSS